MVVREPRGIVPVGLERLQAVTVIPGQPIGGACPDEPVAVLMDAGHLVGREFRREGELFGPNGLCRTP